MSLSSQTDVNLLFSFSLSIQVNECNWFVCFSCIADRVECSSFLLTVPNGNNNVGVIYHVFVSFLKTGGRVVIAYLCNLI